MNFKTTDIPSKHSTNGPHHDNVDKYCCDYNYDVKWKPNIEIILHHCISKITTFELWTNVVFPAHIKTLLIPACARYDCNQRYEDTTDEMYKPVFYKNRCHSGSLPLNIGLLSSELHILTRMRVSLHKGDSVLTLVIIILRPVANVVSQEIGSVTFSFFTLEEKDKIPNRRLSPLGSLLLLMWSYFPQPSR